MKRSFSAPLPLTIRIRIRQRRRRIGPQIIRNQMLKRTRVTHSRRERFQAPELIQRCHDTRMSILPPIIAALLLNHSLAHLRRDKECWDPHTETREVECHSLPIGGDLGVCDVVSSRDIDGRGNVIAESSMLVEC